MEKKAKSETNKITFVFLLLLLIIYSSNAQQEEFIRGVFIHSGEGALTLYGNYDQVQLMGTNSVHQMVVREVPRLGQTNNFQQLSRFNYIYASNDSGTGSENCDWCNEEPENIDWISYFTQAKYMKWEAEGDSIFNGSVGIKHQGGEFYQEADGTKGWKTSDNNIGDTVIYGPNYWQYPRYTFTNPAWNPTPINYKANFRMKIDFPSSESLPVCIIMVLMTKPSTGYSKILDIDTLTTDVLSTAYQNFTLSYNYKDYIIFEGIANSSGIHPATITKPFSEIETNPSLNIGSEVQFIVKWLGNRQLFIDYIEVYDEKIWEYYFINRMSQTKNAIRDYNLSFSSNPNLYEKLKYYVTIDEPHSIDCYIPIKRVQEIMDSLNIDKILLVHWYPGWSHYRDGSNTWPLYYQLAKSKKINFWYAPFVSDENRNNTDNDSTLYWFQRNLQQAHLQQDDFFVTLQTFGWRDKQTNLSYGFRTPTP